MAGQYRGNSTGSTIAMAAMLLLTAAGSWYFYQHLNKSVEIVTLAPSATSRPAGAAAMANRVAGTVRRTPQGNWIASGRPLALTASPAGGAGQFNFNFSYDTSPRGVQAADWAAITRLRQEVNANPPSPAIAATEIAQIKPLLVIEPTLTDAAKSALQTKLQAIAAESVDKPQTDPKIEADEQALLTALMQSGRNSSAVDAPIVEKNVAKIKSVLGDNKWKQLTAPPPPAATRGASTRRAPAAPGALARARNALRNLSTTRPALAPTTLP